VTTAASALLNELIEIARDGERFYDAAAVRVHSDELRSVFRQQADVRRGLMDALGDQVIARGEAPSPDTTLAGRARKAYAGALASLGGEDTTYVDLLEQAEDRLLQHYRDAIAEARGSSVGRILQRHLPTVEAAHDRMRRLQEMSRQHDRAGA
jgi:uncharacterized protein (TIGR02284 family)